MLTLLLSNRLLLECDIILIEFEPNGGHPKQSQHFSVFLFSHILICSVLSLDVMDISGETQPDIKHNILKTRLTDRGMPVPNAQSNELRNDLDKLNEQRGSGYCGSCFGGQPPPSGCCNTCDEVRQAYVDRGWSFNRPDSIEQVRFFFFPRPRQTYFC